MIYIGEMELDEQWDVAVNEVNKICVCVDAKTALQYTAVTVFDVKENESIINELGGRVVDGTFFTKLNNDFVRDFSTSEGYGLLFKYQPINTIFAYARNTLPFADRKKLATDFIYALSDTGLGGKWGRLLIAGGNEDNVNYIPGSGVYFNYFLDFSQFVKEANDSSFLRCAADFAFNLLTEEYKEKYESDISRYPLELRDLKKNFDNGALTSLNEIIQAVTELSDQPQRQVAAVVNKSVYRARSFWALKAHVIVFILLLILVAVYLSVSLYSRARAGQERIQQDEIMDLIQIGEIYLGEEID